MPTLSCVWIRWKNSYSDLTQGTDGVLLHDSATVLTLAWFVMLQHILVGTPPWPLACWPAAVSACLHIAFPCPHNLSMPSVVLPIVCHHCIFGCTLRLLFLQFVVFEDVHDSTAGPREHQSVRYMCLLYLWIHRWSCMYRDYIAIYAGVYTERPIVRLRYYWR